MTDDPIRSLQADVEALQLKVGALEALILANPELRRLYQAVLDEIKQQQQKQAELQATPKKPNKRAVATYRVHPTLVSTRH